MNAILIPVFDRVAFAWLGDRPIISRCLEKLSDIRDIDRIVLVIGTNVGDIAPKYDGGHYHVMTTDPVQPLVEVARRLSIEAVPADNIVVVDPLYPFLDRGNIEQALYLSDDETAAVTVYGEHTLGPTGLVGYSVQRGGNLVEACVGIKRSTLALAPGGAHLGLLGAKIRYIPVSALETICVKSDDGLRIAEAVSSAGLA